MASSKLIKKQCCTINHQNYNPVGKHLPSQSQQQKHDIKVSNIFNS